MAEFGFGFVFVASIIFGVVSMAVAIAKDAEAEVLSKKYEILKKENYKLESENELLKFNLQKEQIINSYNEGK